VYLGEQLKVVVIHRGDVDHGGALPVLPVAVWVRVSRTGWEVGSVQASAGFLPAIFCLP
jgi:hypothetical protein